MKNNRNATQVNPITRTTRVLFDANDQRPTPYFGRGVSRYSGAYEGRKPFTIDEVRWAARAFADRQRTAEIAAVEDAELARLEVEAIEMAEERRLVERMERELSV